MLEFSMNGFVDFTLVVSMLAYTVLAVFVMVICKKMLSGVLVTAAAIAGGYGIYHYACYIALLFLWILRFALIIAIVAFVLGLYPRKHRQII